MHGGLKVYRGSPAAARRYVEADRGRADDYYLAEGTGVAQRYVASPTRGVRSGGTMTGDAYEAWVGGYDPATGAPKGRVRTDAAAVRFVEVVVNGPKSWSLAAALHPEIAAAYDGAQDRAAQQVIGWLAQHATTRVGPRGHQVQVPVQEIEAAVVRHYTSRAGDPHRHLHLQINARVFAEDTWRGLHTVGVRDSLGAINGIGHAAVICDPDFRAALAGRGFTLDTASGEIVELAGFVGPFSARAAQIARNVDHFEATWRFAHPGAEPGPALRRSWDARAWAQDRPDKVVPRDGADLARAWVQELAGLGYHDPGRARIPAAAGQPVRVGTLDRDGAARDVLTRLGARRSGWNAADVRGQVEQLIAARGIIAGGPARLELAEDLTARALAGCVPLLGRRALPEHIRALTSQQVLDVEADLSARFIGRAAAPGRTVAGNVPASAHPGGGLAGTGLGWDGLDAGQRQVVAAMAAGHRLLVIEGAAGAGKTTTLAATRTALDGQGRRLVVVTPTLQAATIAAQQVGAPAFSAAWLAHQHGYRWNTDGAWSRLRVGAPDPLTGHTYTGPAPAAVLRAGDLLLVDEAGMLDQDSARALMVIADTAHARVALVGDRHQLPAVGRGGVLDLAARWANPDACLTLETVHRFADPAYAQLSLSMRTGAPSSPGMVFDALAARGQVRIYPTPAERTQALAAIAAAATATRTATGGNGHGGGVLLVADTREQVAELNGHIRERLVAGGHVDDTQAVTTWAGERIGVGDQITTRRNDRDADVANRDTWTVTGLRTDGAAVVAGSRGQRVLPAAYVRHHVELGYASTVYGAQAATTGAAHLLVGEHTGAAGAYVAMTRGRDHNTAHLVADTLKEARDQWIEVFNRDRADLGPAHAGRLAAQEAAPYATHRPLGAALSDLRDAWTQEHTLAEHLTAARGERDQLTQVVPLRAQHDAQVAAGRAIYEQARANATQVRAHADQLAAVVGRDTFQLAGRLRQEWDIHRPAARAAAQTIAAGTGRIGQHRRAVRQAGHHLQAWAETWRPMVASLPTETGELVVLAAGHDDPNLSQAITAYARTVAEDAHPDHAPAQATAHAARHTAAQALDAYNQTRTSYPAELDDYGNLAWLPDPADHFAETQLDVAELTDQLRAAQGRVRAALAEPAIRSLPQERIETERERWATQPQEQPQEEPAASAGQDVAPSPTSGRQHERSAASYSPKPSRGISR
jgi:exodeoxyribonuclease V alpha subunit